MTQVKFLSFMNFGECYRLFNGYQKLFSSYIKDLFVKPFCMLQNELNDYCLERPEHSLFNVANLEACIATCHDAIECEAISDFVIHRQKSRKRTSNF